MMKVMKKLVVGGWLAAGLCGTAWADAVVPQDFAVTRNGDGSFALTPTGALGEGETWTVIWLSKESALAAGQKTSKNGMGDTSGSNNGEGDFRSSIEAETWLTEKVPVGTITVENAYGGSDCVKPTVITGTATFSGASYMLPAETDSLRLGRVGADGTSFLTFGGARRLHDMKIGEAKGNELKIGRTIPVTYLNRRWDPVQKKIVEEDETVQARILTRRTTVLEDGCWYVAGYIIGLSGRLTVTGHANLILAESMAFEDGLFVNSAKLVAPDGIDVPAGAHLSIFGQGADAGTLRCDQENGDAMIGGRSGQGCGTIDIHGGKITATYADAAGPGVGIGNGAGCAENSGTVNFFGGVVSTWGIGGGPNGVGCTVNVYGGAVDSQRDDGAAFGAGAGATEHGAFNVFDEKMKLILPPGEDEPAFDEETGKWVYHFTTLDDYRVARGSKLRLASFVTVRFPQPTEYLECTCVNQQSVFSSETKYLSPDDAGGGWSSVTVEKGSVVSVKYAETDEAWYLRGRHAYYWWPITDDAEAPALGPVVERPAITAQGFTVSRRDDGKLALEMPDGFSLAAGEELLWIAFSETTWKYSEITIEDLNGRKVPSEVAYQLLDAATRNGLRVGLLDTEDTRSFVPEVHYLCALMTSEGQRKQGIGLSHHGVLSQLDGPVVLPADTVTLLVCKVYGGIGGLAGKLMNGEVVADEARYQYITIGGAKDLQALASGESRGNEFGKPTETLPYLQYDETAGRLVAQPARETIVITNGMTTLEDGKWYSLPNGQSLYFGLIEDDYCKRLTVNGHAHLIVRPFTGMFLSKGVDIAAGGTLSVHVQPIEEGVKDCLWGLMMGETGCTFGEQYEDGEGAGVALGEGSSLDLHGCTVEVYGGSGCAGIGTAANGTVTVYRGTLKVHGGVGAAAIGGGCAVNIVGGNVYAYSGSEDVPAIGGHELTPSEGPSFWIKNAESGEWQSAESGECFGENGASTVRIVNPAVVKYPENDYFSCEVVMFDDDADDVVIGSETKDGSVEMQIGESTLLVYAASADCRNYRIASTCIRPYLNPTNVIDAEKDFLFKTLQPARFDISVTRNSDGTFTLTPTGELENPEDKWVWSAYNRQCIQAGATHWWRFEQFAYRVTPSTKRADYEEPGVVVREVDSDHYGVSAAGGSFTLPSDTERVIVGRACYHPCDQYNRMRIDSYVTVFAAEMLGMAKDLQTMPVPSAADGSAEHPWPVLDENGAPTGWSAYTNENNEVVFTGEGPLPEGFATKPPFSEILPNAPKIHVPQGTKEQFEAALPGECKDKITEVPNYLRFTARNGGVTVKMTKSGTINPPALETASDPAGPWTAFTAGTTTITLAADETVYFRRSDATPTNAISIATSKYWKFTMTASTTGATVEAGGSVMSLLDQTCAATEVGQYAFCSLFNGCKLLTTAPALPATTLANYCYNQMFNGCTSLTNAPVLSATTLADSCYASMFYGCTALTNAPVLPAATLTDSCYNQMFRGCAALTVPPELPATTLADRCYYQMFYGCAALTNAPVLSATTLADSCYNQMFFGCTSLTEPPELPAATLATDCYSSMFYGCTALTNAPVLSATTLTNGCYASMFYGCKALTNAPVLSATTLADSCYASMFYGCIALTEPPELPATTLAGSCYDQMFRGCTALTEPPELPATTLSGGCYWQMFCGCTALTNAPALSATTLANQCYMGMFQDCKSLTSAPALPAETLTSDCYSSMFYGCTALTNTPALPAMTLANSCYNQMFYGCKALTDAPELSATTLADSCYNQMFQSCEALTNAPALPATTLADRCYYQMFRDCKALTEPPELPATTLATYCYFSMFFGCKALTEAPALPAMTLATYCYYSMFEGCTSLTNITMLATDTSASSCLKNWVRNVAPSGVFKKNQAMTTLPSGVNGIPTGWTVVDVCPGSSENPWDVGVAGNGQPAAYTNGTGTVVVKGEGTPKEFNGENPPPWAGAEPEITEIIVPTGRGPEFKEKWPALAELITEVPNYLRFTAKGGLVPVRLVQVDEGGERELADPGLEYAFDPVGPWSDFVVGTEESGEGTTGAYGVNLEDGQTVYLRRKSETPILTFNDVEVDPIIGPVSGKSWKFETSSETYETMGELEAHGNIMSLLDRTCQSREVGEAAFCILFDACNIVTPPELPATNLAVGCYLGMFGSCPLLREMPELPAEKIPAYGYWWMFDGCENLSSVAPMGMKECGICSCVAMFADCTSLTMAPAFAVVKLAEDSFSQMFANCSSLKTAPKLPTEELALDCYYQMFANSGITNAPALPAMKLADYCYYGMFAGCMELVEPPELPATALADSCYEGMFNGCMSLMTAPELPATTLATNCYASMFYGCTALTNAPALPAKKLAFKCYHEMFSECTGLLTAPELPATDLEMMCYSGLMFGCPNIDHVEVDFKQWREGGEIIVHGSGDDTWEEESYSATMGWLVNVAETGMFVGPLELPVIKDEEGGHIPLNWNVTKRFTLPTGLASGGYVVTNAAGEAVEPVGSSIGGNLYEVPVDGAEDTISIYIKPSEGYEAAGTNPLVVNLSEGISDGDLDSKLPTAEPLRDYLSFTARGGTAEIGMTWIADVAPPALETALDKKGPWTAFTAGATTISLAKDETVYFRRSDVTPTNALSPSGESCSFFVYQSVVEAGGNVMSLLDQTCESKTVGENAFRGLFSYCTALMTAPALPATNLAEGCYKFMFDQCAGLTNAPALPATEVAKDCYSLMFQNCEALTVAPALPATNLAEGCYSAMFQNCEALTVAPALPATNLVAGCYADMFAGCAALTDASALSAMELAERCYSGMFHLCTSLTNAPALPATNLVENCYAGMFSGCTSLTVAPALPAERLAEGCYECMFVECTALTNAPALPATNLAASCYCEMFQLCTSLTNAPALPATNLAVECYASMFANCESLTIAPALPAENLAAECYGSMFYGCTSLTNAPALPATNLAAECYGSMFYGCTSLTNAPVLSAENLAESCYERMFGDCAALTVAPALPAMGLAKGCYESMFEGCTSLTTAPELPAVDLVTNCYCRMFAACPSFNAVTVGFTSWKVAQQQAVFASKSDAVEKSGPLVKPAKENEPTKDWLEEVAPTGTFYCPPALEIIRGTSNIPEGWLVNPQTFTVATLPEYLAGYTMELLTEGSALVTNGTDYVVSSNDQVKITFTAAEGYEFVGDDSITATINGSGIVIGEGDYPFPEVSMPDYLSFTARGGAVTIGMTRFSDATPPALETKVGRNGVWTAFTAGETVIPLAVDETVYFRRSEVTPTTAINHIASPDFSFKMTPQGSGAKVEAGGNLMSLLDRTCESKTVGEYAFHSLFASCTALTSAPELPATNLAACCYGAMFRNCSALTNAPALPAETLAEACYVQMFMMCRALTDAPELPATNLTKSCYQIMFAGCSALATAPVLPAMTLAENCYYSMFDGCWALTNAPALPATNLTSSCYYGMFAGCKALTNAPALPAETLTEGCYSIMFSRCEALTDAPVLPATTLATNCYYQMFLSCTALTNTPALPAETLVDGCYKQMFAGCTNVDYLTVGFTNWLDGATEEWLYNVAPTGTFVGPYELDVGVARGESTIPVGWNVVGGHVEVNLPADTVGYGYVVSNLTDGAEVERRGEGVYWLPVGEKVGVYVLPDDGYRVTGTNPHVIDPVTTDTTINPDDLPKAEVAWENVWARCSTAGLPGFDPEKLPSGICRYENEILFVRRTAAGAATFDFAELDAATFAGATIRFVDGEIAVESLKFDPGHGLVFAGGEGTVLKGIADKSVFDGVAREGAGETVWTNLAFTCQEMAGFVRRNGGAIAVRGGGFTLTDCVFTNCYANQFGGAVYALQLTGNSTITNCLFAGNWTSIYNGYGGAVYASAASEGVRLAVVDSAFGYNEAENGGAINTVRITDGNAERPIGLEIRGSAFIENYGDYGGGAVFAEGDVQIEGDSEFEGNDAGFMGAALAVTGVEGYFTPATVRVGRGAVFTDNLVSNSTSWCYGGAIAILPDDCTLDVEGASFIGNVAAGRRRVLAYGGAIAMIGGEARIAASVFDGGPSAPDFCLGGAVDFDGTDAVICNSTFRRTGTEAICVTGAGLLISNCVVVGNGLVDRSRYCDIYLEDADAEIVYTAYGTIDAEGGLAADWRNLANSEAASVYEGETLNLRSTGFNPVAALGVVQDALDITGVPYGSLPAGYSMGAYETATEALVVHLDGEKIFDGTTSSNDCTWTWSLEDASGAAATWDAIEPLEETFALTNWTFASRNAGAYCSTNEEASTRITAAVAGDEWKRQGLFFLFTGLITPRPVTLTSGDGEWTYDAFAHSNLTVTAENFVAGEGVTTNNFATITDVGSCPNSFEYEFADGTLAANYHVTVVTGVLTVVAKPLPPADDPDPINPDVNPTDPEDIEDPTIPFSAFDTTNVYDGVGHTIDTNALVAAYADKFLGNTPSFSYSLASNGTYSAFAPDWTNVVVTSFWYKVSAANFNDVIHPCKVIITNRCVTLTSGNEQWTYDAFAHSNLTVTAENFVEGEGVTTNNFATITDVGSCPNSFDYEFAAGTLAANYHVTVVTGVLTVVAKPQPPIDPDPVNPDVNPTDPGDIVDPTKPFSAFDTTNVYDGVGHTIDTNALVAAYADKFLGNVPSFSYSLSSNGSYSAFAPDWTNVVVTSFWYRVSADNFNDVIHPAKVIITNRCVTLTSGNEQWTYDAQAHSNLTVTAENFVEGEGVETNNFATITDVGSCPNSFEYAFADGTLAANYHVTVVTGVLTVVAKPQPPIDPDPINPDVDPTKPEDITDPTKPFSAFDTTNVYDGVGHTIDTNALVAAYADKFLGNTPNFSYSLSSNGTYSALAPDWTNVVVTSFWYKVHADNFNDVIHPAKVIITNRCVTLTSADGKWTYDAEAHSNLTVTAENFVEGEGVTTNNFATITDVGSCPNSFEYAFADGTLAANYHVTVVTGTLTVVAKPQPPIDPDPVNPDVDPTKPEDITDPTKPFSAFDTTNVYDGVGHTIDTNALVAAYADKFLGNTPSFSYALSSNGTYSALAPDWTNVVVTSFWYKVHADNFNDVIHPAKVIITNRCVTLTSADGKWTYDAEAHSNLTVTAENFVAGEGVTTNNFATITDVGSCPNSFDYEFAAGTLAANYHVTVVTGVLTVVAKPQPPIDPDPINPDVNPTDPGDITDPTKPFSAFDTTNVYDGVGHTIDTNALMTAYADKFLGNTPNFSYSLSSNGTYSALAPDWTNVVVTSFWYKVHADNFNDVIHPAKVIITNRCVTLTSADGEWTYDAEAHSNLTVTAENFVAGEGVETNNFATITDVGTCPNSFDYEFAAGTLAANYHVMVVTGVLTVVAKPQPPIDPDPVNPDVDPTKPEDITDPTKPFSAFDTTNVYDGVGHTIDTNALVAAYADKFLGNTPSFSYALASNGTYSALAPDWTNVVVTSFWYKVHADNFNDVIHPAKVIITNRCVTLTSGSEQWEYDAEAHSNLTVTAENFVEGEGVTTNNFATITNVGSCPNSFDYEFATGTLAANYHVTVVTGTLTVVKGPQPPIDPDPINPDVDPDDPEQREDPTIPFSKYDYVGVYDGKPHTIDTDELKAAYLEALGEAVTCTYSRVKDGDWQAESLTFKDAVVTSFWYRVSSANYADIIRPCKVVITPRPVTFWSESAVKIYDGEPLTTNEVKYTVMTDEPQPFLSMRRLGAYIYEAHYDTEYPEDAEDYYEHRFDGTAGGCLSFRVGDYHARNYDWKFDEMAEFVVHMTSNETRHASVGIANVGVNITEDIARHGEWSKFYRALPGMMTDGMNDAGLVMNVNVVHSDGQEAVKWKGTNLNAFAAIRYCLDNFADAKTAADYLAANVYIPENLVKATDFAYHWMISDASGATYVVEDGVAHLMTDGQTVSNVPVMSNYRLFATADGTANYDRQTVGSYDPYGAGVERSKKVCNQLSRIGGPLDAMNTLESVWYTKAFPAHEPFENPFWYTEFSNKDLGVTITNSNDELFAIAQTQYVEYRRDHDAEGPLYRQGLTWQTVHSSVYDVAAKKLYLRVQEDNANIYEIPLEAGEAPLLGVPGFGTGVSAALSGTGLVPGDAEKISFEVTGSRTEVGVSSNAYEIIWGEVLESNYIVTKDYGWLTVCTADIDEKIDPYPLNKEVDPTDPAAVEDPSTVFSICDCVTMYDGEGHTIIPEALLAAYGLRYSPEGLAFDYSFSQEGPFTTELPVFTNVTATSLWYRVRIPQYNDLVHPCKVLITNRVITLTSPTKDKPFDATPLTFGADEITVGGNGFVAGESFVYSDFASITEEGSTPATFSYEAGPNTLLSNYGVVVSTGLLTITYAPDPRPTEWDMWPTEYDRDEYAFVENWTMAVTNPPNIYFSLDSLAWRLGFVVRWPGGTGRYLKPEEATFKLSTNGREYSCADVLAGRTGGELLTVQTNRAGYVESVSWEVEITPEDAYEAHDLDGRTEFRYTMTATSAASTPSTQDFNLVIPLGNLELVDINGYRVYPVHLHTWAADVIGDSKIQARCVSDPWYELECVFAGETIELELGKDGKFDEAMLDDFRWKTGAYVSDVVISNGCYEARVIFMGANTVVLRQPAPAQIIGGLEFSNMAVGKDITFRLRVRSGNVYQTTRLAKEAIAQSLRSTTDLAKGFTDRVPADRIEIDGATGAVTVRRDPNRPCEFFMLVAPATVDQVK